MSTSLYSKKTTPSKVEKKITIELAEELSEQDLTDLCDAMSSTIEDDTGFGWRQDPEHFVVERYWKGVLLVPERHLLIARLDGIICGAIQLVEPSRHNEAQAFAAQLLASFVAPWARGYGAGHELLKTAENLAIEKGFTVLNLDVRETQTAAIHLYEKNGFTRYGTHPHYAMTNGKVIAGHFYTKTIASTYRIDNIETLFFK